MGYGSYPPEGSTLASFSGSGGVTPAIQIRTPHNSMHAHTPEPMMPQTRVVNPAILRRHGLGSRVQYMAVLWIPGAIPQRGPP